MAFDLGRYEQVTGRLELDGIDFDAFRDAPLAPAHLRCVRYMHDVESHTSCYLRNLLNTKAHHDPDISAFLTLWGYEEHWHGRALARVLEAHGEPAGAARTGPMRARLGWRLSASPLAWMAFSALTPGFLAVHMVFGAVNEWTTQAGYARLATVAEHPVLHDLLHRIMRQEGRHIDYYRTRAVEELEHDRGRAQTVTRTLLRRAWDPVGAKVMPRAETEHLIGTLFAGGEGRAVAARIDRRIDALPGLGGLGLVQRAVTAYGPYR